MSKPRHGDAMVIAFYVVYAVGLFYVVRCAAKWMAGLVMYFLERPQ